MIKQVDNFSGKVLGPVAVSITAEQVPPWNHKRYKVSQVNFNLWLGLELILEHAASIIYGQIGSIVTKASKAIGGTNM